jgi:hypothetical protein
MIKLDKRCYKKNVIIDPCREELYKQSLNTLIEHSINSEIFELCLNGGIVVVYISLI